MKKIPLRLRLTLLSVLLLTVCCAGLTVILNLSASHMADMIEATPVMPATEVGQDTAIPADDAATLTSSVNSQTARSRFQAQSIIYMVLIIVAGGVLTNYMTGKALRPLKELSNQMKKRTVHNLSEELAVPQTHDEIADLTVSFNQMSGKLNEAFAMQKRFSQSAAHELRTPLTVLKTRLDVFKKKKEHTPGEYEKLISVITTHTDRLMGLVKDLLDLTNMDTLECSESIHLKLLLADITLELEPLAEKRKITLLVEGNAQNVIGNKSLLHRAFYNLVENAIKYNVDNGTVNIKISDEGDHAAVVVEDTGIGIPHDLQSLVFEPFYRVDKSRSRQMGGAGLGLATTKTIIDKHNGTIAVSTAPGGGSSFKIIL